MPEVNRLPAFRPLIPGTESRDRDTTVCRTKVAFLAVLLLALVAFGGCGGGGGTTAALTRPSDTRVAFGDQWGLRAIDVNRAYANVARTEGPDAAPGEGVTIGLIDTGIDEDHPLFEGKTITEEFLPNARDETGTRFSHGTAVASVAAGRGVAPGADIAMFAIPLGTGGGTYVPVSLQTLRDNDSDYASVFSHVIGWRDGQRAVDFINLSFGYNGIIDDYSEQELRANFDQAIAAMAQTTATEKVILVWAAGNAHGDPCTATGKSWCVNDKVNAFSVEVLSGLAARIEELRGHTIAVVAVKENGEIADFSNRCGIAADYCIAAPGDDVVAAYFGRLPDTDPDCPGCRGYRGLATVDGTSFAAPMVTGALAIMKQLFRNQLSNTELAARVFATANKRGRYANASVYGQGLLDVGAATSPVGTPMVALGNRVGGAETGLRTTRIDLGEAFGDALPLSFTGREIAAFDALGAPFWFALDDFATAAGGPSATERLRDFLKPAAARRQVAAPGADFAPGDGATRLAAAPVWFRLGFMETMTDAGDGHLALAEHALGLSAGGPGAVSVTAFTTEGMSGRMPATGATLAWRPANAPLGFHAGWMGERQSLLGGTAEGAFGELAADAVFAGIRADAELGGWRAGANMEVGAVTPAVRDGIVTDTSELTTSAFTLHADRMLAGDEMLRFSLSQPLRVETGRASLAVPVGRTKSGDVVRESISADLAPSGRQIDIAAQWHRRLPAGELRLGVVWTSQPGHSTAADPELTLLSGWRLSF